MMDNVIELMELEKFRCCKLNLTTGEKNFCKQSDINSRGVFTGLCFVDDNTFFAIYPAENGPVMYYEEKEYPLKKSLHISLAKNRGVKGILHRRI